LNKSDYDLLKSLGFKDSNKSNKKAKHFISQLLLSEHQRPASGIQHLEPQELEPFTAENEMSEPIKETAHLISSHLIEDEDEDKDELRMSLQRSEYSSTDLI
jgi:hypothetical protein